jgi:hypothetical protein
VTQTSGYQHLDEHIIDYEVFNLLPGLEVRGPRPSLESGSFFVSVGAAQTFGRFCARPYPTILSDELALDVLNLGVAGAGPSFFLRRPRLLACINQARFAIVQVLSGRSEDNSCFESFGTGLLRRRSDGSRIPPDPAYEELLETRSEAFVRQLIAETRSNWLRNFRDLLARIQIPKILFWFSERSPDYTEEYTEVDDLFGQFPQLVNAAMIAKLRPLADTYVECVSSRGLPQPLYDRASGAPTTMLNIPRHLGGEADTHNTYYPSPEMQEDAAAALLGAARSILGPASWKEASAAEDR